MTDSNKGQPSTASTETTVYRQVIGNPPNFDASEKLTSYIERLEQYFVANDVRDTKKVSVLLTSVSAHVYDVIRELCHPDLPSSKSFKELCDLLSTQYTPATSAWRSRIVFEHLSQESGERISDWFVRIKRQAMECNFGSKLNSFLAVKFVTGLRKGHVLDRLCEEEDNAELKTLYQLAVKKEASVMNHEQNAVSADIHRLRIRDSSSKGPAEPRRGKIPKEGRHPRSTWKQRPDARTDLSRNEVPSTAETSGKVCFACNKGFHDFKNCKYRSYRCKICKLVGHLASACKQKESKFLETDSCSGNTDDELQHYLLNLEPIDTVKGGKDSPFFVNLIVENKKVSCEIDTGSSLSIFPDDFYRKLFKGIELKPTGIRLKSYDGSIIVPVGQIQVRVKYNNKLADCKFLVVQGGQRPLVGRDLMQILGITCKTGEQHSVAISDLGKVQSQLLNEYSDLFDGSLGKYKHCKINLSLKTQVQPKFFKPRPIPYAFRESVNQELAKLESLGVITKIETSQWGTPLVVVIQDHTQNKFRLCSDYKVTINPYLDDIQHQVPRIEEIYHKLEGGQLFSKLDFSSAYNQLEVDDETAMLLAWSTPQGIFRVNRLPYGTKPGCKLFQREIDKTLQGCKGVASLLDDLVITGRTLHEHVENLKNVLQVIREAGFKLNKNKCKFFQPELKFLGHIIDKNGLRKDPSKIKAILQAPAPKNVSELRAFLGMVTYHGRFIRNLSIILGPMYKLLKKGQQFSWNNNCEKSFGTVKAAIAADENLVHFNPDLEIILECDASDSGVGAILMHRMRNGEERPISFASRTLNNAERKYATIHKEALAIYFGCKKFFQYLMGQKFIIRSDHRPLLSLLGEAKGLPQMTSGRMQRWALFLANFDYELQYVKGSHNGADGLSRLPIVGEEEPVEPEHGSYLNFIEEFLPVAYSQIKIETRRDPCLSKIFKFIQGGWPGMVEGELKPYFLRREELHIESEVVMWGYRVVIPSKLRMNLLNELHSSHMGATKMKTLARSYFWWPLLDENISDLAKSCKICLASRPDPPRVISAGWPEPTAPMDRIHVDYAGPVFGNKMFLIIIDAFSKWPEVFEVNKADTSNTLDKLREVFARFGLPKCLVSDNGTCFSSKDFSDFCNKNGITHLTSPVFHPSSNGQAENFVKSFKISVSKMLHGQGDQLHTRLQRFLYFYRNTPHSTTGKPPSNLMFNRKINIRFDQILPNFSFKDSKFMPHNRRQISNFKEFKVGTKVYARDYTRPNKRGWIPAEVIEILGNYLYICEADDGRILKRHINQLIEVGKFFSEQVAEPKSAGPAIVSPNFEPCEPPNLRVEEPSSPKEGSSRRSMAKAPSPPKGNSSTVEQVLDSRPEFSGQVGCTNAKPARSSINASQRSPSSLATTRTRRNIKPPERLGFE